MFCVGCGQVVNELTDKFCSCCGRSTDAGSSTSTPRNFDDSNVTDCSDGGSNNYSNSNSSSNSSSNSNSSNSSRVVSRSSSNRSSRSDQSSLGELRTPITSSESSAVTSDSETDSERSGCAWGNDDGRATVEAAVVAASRAVNASSPESARRGVFGIDYELAKKNRGKFSAADVQRIREWIESFSGRALEPGADLCEQLRSGVHLCFVLNNIRPGLIPKVHVEMTIRNRIMLERENIRSYMEGCRKLGMDPSELFTFQDIVGDRRNEIQVINNLFGLGGIAQSMRSDAPKGSIILRPDMPDLGVRRSASTIHRTESRARGVKQDFKHKTSNEMPVAVCEVVNKAPEGSHLKGFDHEISQRAQLKHSAEELESLRRWVEVTSQHALTPGADLFDALKDGQALCKLVNRIRPNSVKKIQEGNKAFHHRANIENYLHACKELGLPSKVTFQFADLYERKYPPGVVQNLYALQKLSDTHARQRPVSAASESASRPRTPSATKPAPSTPTVEPSAPRRGATKVSWWSRLYTVFFPFAQGGARGNLSTRGGPLLLPSDDVAAAESTATATGAPVFALGGAARSSPPTGRRRTRSRSGSAGPAKNNRRRSRGNSGSFAALPAIADAPSPTPSADSAASSSATGKPERKSRCVVM